MRRVLVIGPGGAGKSTVSRILAERTGLPLVHLDALYWKPGWQPTPDHEWDATVAELLRRDAWVMDGNYGRTLEQRLAAADMVIFLDMPRGTCLRRIVQRRLRYHGRSRPDAGEGCPERLTWEFLRWVWTYPKARRPRMLDRLRKLGREKRVVVLRSAAEVDRFLASL